MPEQGDIVLIPVPFTDLSSQKRRPVIVVSNDLYNRQSADVVVVAMTSNPAKTPFSFRVTSSELIEGTLNRPGTVRVDRSYISAMQQQWADYRTFWREFRQAYPSAAYGRNQSG